MRSDADIKRLLLATAARGEGAAEAFEALYKACAPLLFGIAQRIVRRRELAEEVLHDGFTRIWAAAGRFDPLAEQPPARVPPAPSGLRGHPGRRAGCSFPGGGGAPPLFRGGAGGGARGRRAPRLALA